MNRGSRAPRAVAAVVLGIVLVAAACRSGIEPLPKKAGAAGAPVTGEPDAPTGINWTAYLYGPTHTSHNTEATSITKGNAADLKTAWEWTPDAPTEPDQPPAQLFAGPTIYEGRVYIGSNSGDFYALDESSGTLVWKRSLGYLKDNESCGRRGTTSTAAVSNDPESGEPTVYVGAADGYLYALNADDGTDRWKSQVVSPDDDGHNWSSPTISNGRVYIGIASHCKSTVRGGVRAYDQATGDLLHTYWAVPENVDGGSVWSSVAASSDGKAIYLSTGNGDLGGGNPGDSFSLVRLNAQTLEKQDIWTAPLEETDLDFGASPTLFSATLDGEPIPMVGACNKNGRFYALNQNNMSAGPVWEAELSGKWPANGNCLGAAVWNSEDERLYMGAAQTTVDGEEHRGSIREVDPATGEFLWELGLPGVVWGSSSMNANNVLAVPSFDTDPEAVRAVWLVDADTGELLKTVHTTDSPVFAQPVFADDYLFVATVASGLIAFHAGP